MCVCACDGSKQVVCRSPASHTLSSLLSFFFSLSLSCTSLTHSLTHSLMMACTCSNTELDELLRLTAPGSSAETAKEQVCLNHAHASFWSLKEQNEEPGCVSRKHVAFFRPNRRFSGNGSTAALDQANGQPQPAQVVIENTNQQQKPNGK